MNSKIENRVRAALEARRQARVDQIDVDAVFAESDRAVRAVTGDRIGVRVVKVPPMKFERSTFAGAIASMLHPDLDVAVQLHEPGNDGRVLHELGRMQSSALGYPVSIYHDGQTTECADKEALEDLLAELLESPEAADVLEPPANSFAP